MNGVAYKNQYTNKIFRYIENNMPENLDTHLLSNVGSVSCAQLYRDFYSITGHSVKEYIRKRRLSNALALIKSSNMSITDIAFQCGYSSHQALCRSIRATLGITPSQYKNSSMYYFFPPFNGEPLQSVIVSSETMPRSLRVSFYHSRLAGIENIAVGTFLRLFPDYSGRIFGRNGKQESNKFCYELCLTDININYDKLQAYGFVINQEILCFSATFAASTVKNDERQINAAWNYLYSYWLHNSMFEYTDENYYEEYILKNGRPVKLKLYLPIRKRGEDTKITLVNNPELRFIVSKAKGNNAEKIASRTVINYLTAYYPYVVKTSKEFYLRQEFDSYTCGVRINSDMAADRAVNIEIIGTEQNNYIVLESSVMGDYERYAGMLLSFAGDNGMTANKNGLFAVYDAKDNFENPKIKMYCPVKIEKK